MARRWSHKLYIYSKKIDIPVDYSCEYLSIYPLTVAISTELHVFSGLKYRTTRFSRLKYRTTRFSRLKHRTTRFSRLKYRTTCFSRPKHRATHFRSYPLNIFHAILINTFSPPDYHFFKGQCRSMWSPCCLLGVWKEHFAQLWHQVNYPLKLS